MNESQPYLPMASFDTYDFPGTASTKRTQLTKAQKAALFGASGAALLSGSALAWGMSEGGIPNPFRQEAPPASDQPDVDGELTGEIPPGEAAVTTPTASMPADSTAVATPLQADSPEAIPSATPSTAVPASAEIPTLAPVGGAGSANAGTAFGQAFAEAREEVGPGGYFVWNGNVYNTFFKEEWEAMSTSEQQDYVAAVQNDRLDAWQNENGQTENLTIDDSGQAVLFGNPDDEPDVPVEPAQSEANAEVEWVQATVDGHRLDLGNADADDTAELAIVDGRVALVDIDNDGTFDVGGRVNTETGDVEQWVELPRPIEAPAMGDVRGMEEGNPAPSQYTSQEPDEFGPDFDNQAGTADFV